MEKPDPQKRKSIHDREIPIDEMRDNDKNSAKMIHEKCHDKSNSSDEDIVTSDEEEDERETNLITHEDHTCINKKDELTESTHTRRRKSSERQLHINDTYTTNTDNSKLKRNISSYPRISLEKKLPRRTFTPSEKSNNTRNCIYIIGVFSLFIAVILFVYLGYFRSNNSINIANDNTEIFPMNAIKLSIKNMASKYKNQERKLWEDAYNSICEIIRKPKTPSIILLLGNTTDPLSCLAAVLGDISSKALDSDRVILRPEKFDSDVGSVIENLRLKLRKNKAVIIWDLLNINVEALRAFHNLCDRINPLVEEVIFIITIISNNYDKKSNPLDFIHKELTKKLSGKMKNDDIQPLITRITDGPILIVKPEPTVTDCPKLT